MFRFKTSYEDWRERGLVDDTVHARRERAIGGEKVGLAEWNELRLNSYERHSLMSFADDELLAYEARYCLSQCSREKGVLSAHYNDAAVKEFLPMVLDRFEALLKKGVST